MAHTPRGIWYPTTGDSVRPASRDFRDQAMTTNAAIDAAVHEASWRKNVLPNNTDLTTMSGSGSWWINNGANARTIQPELPEPGAGVLTRLEISNNNWEITWRPFLDTAPGGAPIPTRTWRLQRFGTGNVSEWVTDTATPRKLPLHTDLDEYRRPADNGPWQIFNTNDAVTIDNRPPFTGGFYLEVKAWNNVAWQVAWPAGRADQMTSMMRKFSALDAEWSEWLPLGGGQSESAVDVPQAHMMLKQRNRLGHGGTIGVGDKTAVGLSFDHGFANYRDILLPHLTRLGLPHALAVNTNTLGSGENEGVSYSELQHWAIQHGAVLVNHGRSHADATTPEGIRDMILGSLELLQDNCPKTIIDTYIAPGTSGTGLDGFNNGMNDYTLWWKHIAGQTILAHHATVTAGLHGMALPLDGDPIQSMDRVGFDYAWQANAIKDRITALAGTGMGIQIFNHPSLIGTNITEAEIIDFLEWLATERDADRIEVLSSSAFAWAVSGTEKRHDLIAGRTWSSESLTVPLTPLYDWVRGYQRQLAVTCSEASEVTLSVTDDTGLLNALITQSVPAGGIARLNFGIPTDSNEITLTAVTTNGELSNRHMYAV